MSNPSSNISPALPLSGEVVVLMTRDEAAACVALIKSSVAIARRALFDLYEQRGWEALGYPSWRQCVLTEFAADASEGYMYRQLAAARVEHASGLDVGSFPEPSLRPVYTILKDEEDVARAIAIATSNGDGSVASFEAAAKRVYVLSNAPLRLAERMIAGEVGESAAYRITLSCAANLWAEGILAEVSDPDLALAIVASDEGVVTEMATTGFVPTMDGSQVPLGKATLRDLEGYYERLRREKYAADSVDVNALVLELTAIVLANASVMPERAVELARAIRRRR